MEKTEIIMTMAKETKGTFVYEEKLEAGKPPVLKPQYVQKWILGPEPPKQIKVTIEPA